VPLGLVPKVLGAVEVGYIIIITKLSLQKLCFCWNRLEEKQSQIVVDIMQLNELTVTNRLKSETGYI